MVCMSTGLSILQISRNLYLKLLSMICEVVLQVFFSYLSVTLTPYGHGIICVNKVTHCNILNISTQ